MRAGSQILHPSGRVTVRMHRHAVGLKIHALVGAMAEVMARWFEAGGASGGDFVRGVIEGLLGCREMSS